MDPALERTLAVGGSIVITLFLVLVVSVIARSVRPAELRLLLLGIFVAVAALLYDVVAPRGVALGMGGPGGPEMRVSAAPSMLSEPTAILLRIGLILVLTGVTLTLWSRWSPAPALAPAEEVGHGK